MCAPQMTWLTLFRCHNIITVQRKNEFNYLRKKKKLARRTAGDVKFVVFVVWPVLGLSRLTALVELLLPRHSEG